MLSINLNSGEYITIGGNIFIQAYPFKGRVTLRVEAPREIPVMRGALAEKAGSAKPEVIAEAERRGFEPKVKQYSKRIHDERRLEKLQMWQTRRENAREALDTLYRISGDIEPPELREKVRKQLEAIYPAVGE